MKAITLKTGLYFITFYFSIIALTAFGDVNPATEPIGPGGDPSGWPDGDARLRPSDPNDGRGLGGSGRVGIE